MFSFFQKKYTLIDKEHLRSKHAQGISYLMTILAVASLIIVAIGVTYIITLPREQRRALEKELAIVQARYEQELAHEKRERDHYRWLHDQEYFEQIVRDRENLAHEGEKVIRIIPPKLPTSTSSSAESAQAR